MTPHGLRTVRCSQTSRGSRDDTLPRAQPRRHRGRSASPSSAALILAALRADDLPLIGGGDTYYAAFTESGGLKERRGPHRRRPRRQGRRRSRSTAATSWRPSRSTAARTSAPRPRAAIKVKTLLGAMFLALEPAGEGQLDGGLDDPGRAHHLAVRRRGRLRRASPRPRRRSTPTSSPSRYHAGRPDPQHPRGVPRRPSTASPACRRTSRPGPADQRRCWRTSTRWPGSSTSATEDIIALMRDADVLFRALVARRRGDPQPAGVDLDAVARADPAGPAEPRRPQAGPDAPGERRRPCSTRTRTTSTTACG